MKKNSTEKSDNIEKSIANKNMTDVANLSPKEIEHNIQSIAKEIASALQDSSKTFSINKGWIISDLGGSFEPSCREMEICAEKSPEILSNENSDVAIFERNETVDFYASHYRLYYDVLKRTTNYQFLSLELSGEGCFSLTISSQTEHEDTVILKEYFEFNLKKDSYTSSLIEINTLAPNASLVISLSCESEVGVISKFRWRGHIHAEQANLGERIIAVRTFGNRASVSSSLNKIIKRISTSYPEILKRTLFLIYDATGDKINGIASDIGNARIIELQGPNYGGGGNASVLISMLIRAGKITENEISEITLFDDDAHIDAESIIRHDSFITGRKRNFISTSVVYSRQNPTVIQEFGGIWGRNFCPNNHGISINNNDSPRLLLPYLVRATRDIANQYHARYIAKHQEVEFSTFIFISFPYECLVKIGAPLPVFLRNDDAEICLRAIANGNRIVVNPNLYAWHDSAHNPIGEFYATLHGLIINSRYGGLNRLYLYRVFMDRISRLATVGNVALLSSYSNALELYSIGPNWMAPDTIYDTYSKVRSEITNILINDADQIPFEVIDVLKRDNQVEIRNLIDITPKSQNKNNIVFIDTKEDIYYSFKSNSQECKVTFYVESCLRSLNYIAENIDRLMVDWSNYVSEFNHEVFWDYLLSEKNIKLKANNKIDESLLITGSKEKNKKNIRFKGLPKTNVENNSNEIVSSDDKNSAYIPGGFDPNKYLRLNPDVEAAGIDPYQHWFLYGQHENRPF
jgi:GT2 family glycosyltransferase